MKRFLGVACVALTLVGCGPSKEVETLQKRAREVAANIDDRRAELQSAKTTRKATMLTGLSRFARR